MNDRAFRRILAAAAVCLLLFWVETVWKPGYVIKSGVKLLLFTGAVLAFCDVKSMFRCPDLKFALALGLGIYGLLLLAFFLFRPFIDLQAIAAGLLGKEGVSRKNFLWVAMYISIVNSGLEELLFRGLGYLELRRHTSDRFALVFSAAAFSVYHVGILSGWFRWWIHGLCLLGLFAGGLVFGTLDRRGSILPSWLAHGAANLAINTIGLMMFGLLPN